MRKVRLSKIKHRGSVRIKVDFDYNVEIISTIKSLDGSKWSQTKKCWHLPYTKASYTLLKQNFHITLPFRILDDPIDKFVPKEKKQTKIIATKQVLSESPSIVKVQPEHKFRVKVLVPYQQKTWIQKIKSLPNRAWNKEKQYWSVPKTKETLSQLQQLFGELLAVDNNIHWNIEEANTISNDKEAFQKERPNNSVDKNPKSKEVGKNIKEHLTPATSKKSYKIIEREDRTIKTIVGQKIIVEQENEQWLRVFVPYDKKGWIGVVKNILGRKWNVEDKCWLIPYVQDNLDRLNALIGQEYIQFTFEINSAIPTNFQFKKQSKKRRSGYTLNDVQQRALLELDGQMQLENKRFRTRKTYKSLFKHFLAYFPNTKPSQISKAQIEQYIILKKQDNISDSQLNQLINVFNCFYIRLLEQEEKVVRLQRPKKKRKLPNVYSLEEMQELLKASANLKHKCMLLLIYSGGLRRSEVLNLRVSDLNFERKTLFVHNGKGGKDRYTFFSEVAQKYLKKYLQQNELSYYLFEGQHGGKYSKSSIQKVFDLARKKSRVPRNVTIHGLRHSFATHLIEKGVPLHVVQELLGHSSIKTTEVYLHISNKFRKELKSPLDDMNI